VLRCVAVCCGVLRCVAICCSTEDDMSRGDGLGLRCVESELIVVLRDCVQCVAVCCGVSRCVVGCCSVLRYVAVCCSVLQCVARSVLRCVAVFAMCCCGACGVLHCVAACCSVLQCVAVCCAECVAMCCGVCGVLQCVAWSVLRSVAVFAVCCSELRPNFLTRREDEMRRKVVCCSVLQCVAVCLQCVAVSRVRTSCRSASIHIYTYMNIIYVYQW